MRPVAGNCSPDLRPLVAVLDLDAKSGPVLDELKLEPKLERLPETSSARTSQRHTRASSRATNRLQPHAQLRNRPAGGNERPTSARRPPTPHRRLTICQPP